MGNLFLALGCVSLLAGILCLWIGAAGSAPGLSPSPPWRVVFGILGVGLLGGVTRFALEYLDHIRSQKPIRRSSERGDLLVSPRALRDLIGALLERELGLRKSRIAVRDESEGLRVHIVLHLPPGEDLPSLTERVQDLISREVGKRIGIPVLSVDLSVHGLSHASEKPPKEQTPAA